MTQMSLEDPGSVFLASGDPARFLEDNLPSTEPASPAEDDDHRHVAVALAGAFLAWRILMLHRLRQEAPPVEPEKKVRSILWKFTPAWVRLFGPPVLEAYHLFAPQLRQEEREAIANDYVARLGQYVHQTSADALVGGYRAQLARGVNPTLAWMRAIEGFGLDSKKMRSWLAAQGVDLAGWTGIISPGAQRALDKALLLRADLLGATEAWQLRMTARNVVWMADQRDGTLPVGARKQWITADDEMVCPICRPLHMALAKVDDQFVLPTGQSVWAPGVHPNCRCELELVYPDVVEKAWDETKHPRDRIGRFTEKIQDVAYPASYHKQVRVRAPGGAMIEIDEGLVNLLPALWREGISTRFSCEGPGDRTIEELESGAPIAAYIWITNADRWDALKAQRGHAPVLDHITETDRDNGIVLRFESRYIEPLTQWVSTVAKNAPGDPYDRDSEGRFARQESRRRATPPRMVPVREREPLPEVEQLFAQMGEAPVAEEEKEAVLPSIRGDLLPQIRPTALPSTTGLPSIPALPSTQGELPGVFAPLPAIFGHPMQRQLIIYPEAQGVHLRTSGGPSQPTVYIPTDWFWPVWQANDYIHLPLDDSTVTGPTRVHPRINQAMVANQATIDFDEWARRNARRQDLPEPIYFNQVARGYGSIPHQMFVTLATDYDLARQATRAEHDQGVRYMRALDEFETRVLDNADVESTTLSLEDLRHIYRNAGQYRTVDVVQDRAGLRNGLLHAINNYIYGESSTMGVQADDALAHSYLEYMSSERPSDSLKDEMTLETEGDLRQDFLRVPQVFTFKDNRYKTVDVGPGPGEPAGALEPIPHIAGKYRVVGLRKHSMIQDFGGAENVPRSEEEDGVGGNPRFPAWEEVVLELIEDQD